MLFLRFEFTVSLVELHRRTLDVAVKNGGGLLSKHKGLLGKVLVSTRPADENLELKGLILIVLSELLSF